MFKEKRRLARKDFGWGIILSECSTGLKRVYVKLAETPKIEDIGGVKSDKEVVDLIDADIEDGNIVNILIASIHAADQECDDF
ncbi:hypothetical protein Tco_0022131, partial [Tanacetum coccineum]